MTHHPPEEKILTHEAPHTFEALGISEKLLSVLHQVKFTTPTPIQQKAIPIAIEGKDLVGIAQTGTGKSLAFGLPMLQLLLETHSQHRGLIILPTRELASQINETLQTFGRQFGVRTAILIGGAPMFPQIKQLNSKPHIIIGTPGRIIDHIQQKNLSLHNISILVLDEADCMFDMGFAPQIKQILHTVPKNRQTMLFSATMPDSIIKIATLHMKLPVRVEMARQGSANEKVDHELFFIKRDYKVRLLENLLKEYQGTVLVFCRTKHTVKKLCHSLYKKGFSSAEIHSNRTLAQRRQALEGFKSGKYRILVATDIASRGIDVKGIELVINYDLPESPGDYVHRIGRTGRAGLTGKAISLVTPDQKFKVKEIERLIRSTIPILQVPELPEIPPAPIFEPKETPQKQNDFENKRENKNRSEISRSKHFRSRRDDDKNKSRHSRFKSFGGNRSEDKNKSGHSRFKSFDGNRFENKTEDSQFKSFGRKRNDERNKSDFSRFKSFGGNRSEEKNKSGFSRFKSFGKRNFENKSGDFRSKPFGERHSEDRNKSARTRFRSFDDRNSENKSGGFRSKPFGERHSDNKSKSNFSRFKSFSSRRDDDKSKSAHSRFKSFGNKHSDDKNKSEHTHSKPFIKEFGQSNFKKKRKFFK